MENKLTFRNAERMSDWTVYRITGDTLKQLGGV